MAFVTGAGYTVEVDLTDAATSYELIDFVSVDESMNEVVDTFFRLSQGGYADNVVTAIDPEYSGIVKAESTDTVISDIAKLRHSIGADRNFSLKITDNYTSESITVPAVFTSIGSSRTVEAVIEIPISIKFRGEPTVA